MTGWSGRSPAGPPARGKLARKCSPTASIPQITAALELPLADPLLHAVADGLPSLRADARVDPAIADDLEVAVGQQEVDEDPVVVLGIPDPQLAEHLDRALARGDPAQDLARVERVLDGEADLTAVRGLAFADRRLDIRERLRREHLAHAPRRREQVPQRPLHVHAPASTTGPTRRRRRTRPRHHPSRRSTLLPTASRRLPSLPADTHRAADPASRQGA